VNVLRDAGTEDRAWLADVLARPAARRHLAVDAPAAALAALDRRLAGADDEGVVVLVDEDGTPLATARWTLRNRRSRIAVVHGLAVDPARAGRGHGTALVRALVEHLVVAHDVHRVEAEAFAANEAALRTFARAGFAVEGRRVRAYDRDGAWQDSVLLARVADGPPRSAPPGG
jgi:RimJ/RimL family protein N-acetyltransferase